MILFCARNFESVNSVGGMYRVLGIAVRGVRYGSVINVKMMSGCGLSGD